MPRDDDDDIVIIIRRAAASAREWILACWRRMLGG